MSDRDKIIKVIARAIAADEDMPFRAYAALYRLSARAILTALDAAGMAVVPVEPTPEMAANGARHLDGYDVISADLTPHTAESIWAAMLSASPYGKASTQEASAERAARSEQIPPGKEESK